MPIMPNAPQHSSVAAAVTQIVKQEVMPRSFSSTPQTTRDARWPNCAHTRASSHSPRRRTLPEKPRLEDSAASIDPAATNTMYTKPNPSSAAPHERLPLFGTVRACACDGDDIGGVPLRRGLHGYIAAYQQWSSRRFRRTRSTSLCTPSRRPNKPRYSMRYSGAVLSGALCGYSMRVLNAGTPGHVRRLHAVRPEPGTIGYSWVTHSGTLVALLVIAHVAQRLLARPSRGHHAAITRLWRAGG